MGDNSQESRINKFDKRRKTTKAITTLLIIGVVLAIVFIFVLIFGGNDSESKVSEQASSEIQRKDDGDIDYIKPDEDDEDQEESENDEEKDNKEEDKEKVETKEVESSDDNVTKAYEGNWKPIGTEQSGPHTTNYDDGSQDRIEIKEAIRSATGLEDMVELWIGNGGDQKVIATVATPDNSDIYRVYLSWIDEEGWQPTKVEKLKENDTPS